MNFTELQAGLRQAGVDPDRVNMSQGDLDLWAHNIVFEKGFYTSYVNDGRDEFFREFSYEGRPVEFVTEDEICDYLWKKLTAPTPVPKKSTHTPEQLEVRKNELMADTLRRLSKRRGGKG
ncbi:hypothetical protein [Frondihabitans cladoniiphilus]|uniref:Uncharacterized protein n=1 Tax=Frondihabitans cladoniiphilus TaxID=715785 RepID=A0ABP8VLM5_9MICO